ncbi:MAG: tetratricopeptide repeat protein [Defluviitaleaceae bacterium]|nr:tetratricopeptide repeat protein [Defluviitaleaceae bacterium]
MNPWHILNIEETEDKEAIKRAYMQAVSKHNPEVDSEGFQKVRAAYEQALKQVDNKNKEEDTSLASIFVKKIEENYKNFKNRLDIEKWEQVFSDDILVSLATEDEATYGALNFFINNYYLPASVWVIVKKRLKIEENVLQLKKSFHPGFIDFIMNQSNAQLLSTYDLFIIEDGKDYDKFMYLSGELTAKLDLQQFENFEETLNELENLGIKHPDIDLMKARFLVSKDSSEENREQAERLIEKVFSEYDLNNYYYGLYSKAVVYFASDKEKALQIWREAAKLYDNYYVHNGIIEALISLSRFEEAKQHLDNLPQDLKNSTLSRFIPQVEENLIEVNKKAYEEEQSEENIKKLVSSYYNAYKSDELLELLMKHDLDTAVYHQQLAYCYTSKNQIDKALEHCRYSLEKEESYFGYLILISTLANKYEYDEVLRYSDKALSLELTEEGREKNSKTNIYSVKAFVLMRLKNFEEALKTIEEAIERDPNNLELIGLKAEILKNQGNFGESYHLCDYCINVAPKYPLPYELLAEIFFKSGNSEELDKLVEEANQNEVVSLGLEHYKGASLTFRGKIEEAITLFEALLEKDLGLKWKSYTNAEMAFAKYRLNKLDEAITHLKSAIEDLGDHKPLLEPNWFSTLAFYYQAKGENEKAIDIMEEGLLQFPENNLILEEKAFFLKGKDDNLAIEIFKTLSERIPHSEAYVNQIALGLEAMGKKDEALSTINQGIDTIKDSKNLRLRRAELLKNMGREEEALKDYLEVIENETSETWQTWWALDNIYSDIADLYNKPGNETNYLKFYELAVNENPKSFWANFMTGAIYSDRGEYGEALKYLEEALTMEPDEPMVLYEIAEIYEKQGEKNEAQDMSNKIIRIVSKNNSDYHRDYRYLADAYISLNDFKKATKAIEKAHELMKTDGSTQNGIECFCIYHTEARYYVHTGNLNKALEKIEKAISLKNSISNDLFKKEILGLIKNSGTAPKSVKQGIFAKIKAIFMK